MLLNYEVYFSSIFQITFLVPMGKRQYIQFLVFLVLESSLFPSVIYRIDELILPNNDFDSKIDETVVGILSIRNIEVNVPFTITAYMENDEIKIFGMTEIDTTWFGFEAPTKFNAWEVLNPIAIEVDLVAKRK